MVKRLFLICLLCCSGYVNADAANLYERALTEFNEGNIGDSYILLKNALQHNDDHLPSKLLMGRVLLIDGHVFDAIDEFEEVLAFGADKNLVVSPLARAYLFAGRYDDLLALQNETSLNPQVKLDLIILSSDAHIRQGDVNKALQILQRAKRTHPRNIRLNNVISGVYIRQGELAKTETLIQESLALEPQNIETLHMKGMLKANQNNNEEAIALFSQVLDKDPDNPIYLRSMATALAESGEYDKANELVLAIEKQTPGDVQNRLLKARILALTNQQFAADSILLELSNSLSLLTEEQKNERLQLSLITGVVAYINKNYDLASTELSRFASERPASAEILGMLADALLNLGYYDEALKALEKNIETVVTSLEVANLTCEVYLALRRELKCRNILQKIEKNFPDAPEVVILNAKLLAHSQQFTQAAELLNKHFTEQRLPQVLEMQMILSGQLGDMRAAQEVGEQLVKAVPNSLPYKSLLADIYIRTGEIQLASNINQQVLSTDPSNIAGLVTKARLEVENGDNQRALAILEQIIGLEQNNISALLLSSQVHALEENFESAIDRLLLVKTLRPRDPRPRELLTSIYLQQNALNLALSEVNQLLNLNRLSDNYMLQRAQIMIALEKFDEAVSQLKVLAAKWSDSPANLLRLSSLQVAAGDIDSANSALQRAIQLNPENQLSHLEYVNFLLEQDQLEQARMALNVTREKFGNTASVMLLRGHYSKAMNANQTAFQHYMAAHKINPQFQLALINMYELARIDIERQTFLNYLEKLSESDDTNYFAIHLLADMHFIDSNYADAERLYRNLVSSNYSLRRYSVYNNLANIVLAKDAEKALEYANQALELNPESALVLDTKGWVLANSNRLEEALDILRKAYVLNSEEPVIHYHIAYTLNQLGRGKEAREILEDNNTLANSFVKIDEAKALMQAIRND